MDLQLIPTLEEILQDLPNLAKACRAEKNNLFIAKTCEACRDGWAAYYDRYLSSRSDKNRVPLEQGMRLAVSAIKNLQTIADDHDLDHELIRHALENIEFRLHLLHTLHSADNGVDAVNKEIDARALKLVQ